MKAVSKAQIRSIYGLGANLGMIENGRHDDDLHLLVDGLTGKNSISSLTYDEAEQVAQELRYRMRFSGQQVPSKKSPKKHAENPGGVSTGQQRKVWALMYELQKSDLPPSPAPLGDRLTGILKKELCIDATAKEPFQWLTHQHGNRLIEILKGYVATAKSKARKRGDSG